MMRNAAPVRPAVDRIPAQRWRFIWAYILVSSGRKKAPPLKGPQPKSLLSIARSNSAQFCRRRRWLREKRMHQIRFGFIARFAPTVLSAFQTGRLVALSSVSSIFIIVLLWPHWPSLERLPATMRWSGCGARADQITVMNGGALTLSLPILDTIAAPSDR